MLIVSAETAVFVLVASLRGWYSPVIRVFVVVFASLSAIGGVWFVLAGLSGGETLIPASVFIAGQAVSLGCVIGFLIVRTFRYQRDSQSQAERNARRDTNRDIGRDPERDEERDAGRDTYRDSQRDEDRDEARDPGRDAGRDEERDAERDSE